MRRTGVDPVQDPTPRVLPGPLRELADLSLDLRWMNGRVPRAVWERIDPDTFERTSNPSLILLNAHEDRLAAVARDPELMRELEAFLARWRAHLEDRGWFASAHAADGLSGIAYFSMEFGLAEALRIHSGGLGILAGDYLKSASDLGVPLVGIGLLYQRGYFRQVLSPDGDQLEAMPYTDP